MKIIKKMMLFTVLVVLFSCVCSPVFAEDVLYESSLVFGPPTQRIMLEAGQTYRSSVYISNPSDSVRNTKYVLYVTPYGVTDKGYTPVFDQNNTYTQIAKWITLDATEGVLQPGEKHDIGFTINVPEDAPAGGQYATIMAQDITDLDSDEKEKGLSISSITAIGTIIFADIAGTTRNDAEIIDNNFPSILFNNVLSAESTVKNNGNVHTDAQYTLQVWPLFSDEEICTNEENVATSLIMPETERYHVETCNLPSVGIFRAKQTVQIFGETSIVEKTIIVCPLWLLAIIVFAIVLLIMWLIMKAKARNQNK